MILKRLTIRGFGKIHDKTLEFSPGINVLCGENESGKTTVHTCIRSMLYGIFRGRGRAARDDVYAKYEPWANPASFGGILWFEKDGKNYRLIRNFYKENPQGELLGEDDGILVNPDGGAMERLLGNVSPAIYDNTVSVAQLKGVTGKELAGEVQNYMAGYQGTGDCSLDLGRSIQMLKMSRKGFLVQREKQRKEQEREREKLAAQMDYLSREMDELTEQRDRTNQKEESMKAAVGAENPQALIEERIRSLKGRRRALAAALVIALVLAVAALAGRFSAADQMSRIGWDVCITAAAAVVIGYFPARRKNEAELSRQKKLRRRFSARQEKLQWNREALTEAYREKKTAFENLQSEYQDYEDQNGLPTRDDVEIQALNMAMETIETVSADIHQKKGQQFRLRTAQILSEITGGKYREVLLDEELHVVVNTADRAVPAERLSRGTLEQVYFALRMAAAELFCGQDDFPVILDEVFGMYDEDRLAAALHWLEKEKKQVIISTCSGREAEILQREGIPCRILTI